MDVELNVEKLSGIAPDRIVDSYQKRKLDSLSDAELLGAAVQVIGKPKLELDSFLVHAPLEVMARHSLLPLVSPGDRDLARIQIVATAAHYEAESETAPVPGRKLAPMSAAAAMAELRRALQEGDVELADVLCVRLAKDCGLGSMLDSIADVSLRTLTGAAHTHIGLMLMARIWNEVGPAALNLARAGLRMIAQAPQLNLRPVTRHITLQDLEKELEARLRKVPALPGGSLSRGVHGIIQAAEEAGLADGVIGDALLSSEDREGCENALRTVCRISAYSMLADKQEHAKYGWTHCLTMPQAAWALTRFLSARSFIAQAAHSAATWVIGIRAALGNGNLNLSPELQPAAMELSEALVHSPAAAASMAWFASAEQRPEVVRTLATEAAIRNDAHLVKYAFACLDAAGQDPSHAHLFHAAAAYLCSIWCLEQPRERILDALSAGRN